MFGLKPRHKKYIRPVLGLLIFVLGAVFLLIPFIPLGYILLLIGAFFLAPVVPFLRRLLNRLKKKDSKHRVERAEGKMNQVEESIDDVLIDEPSKKNGNRKSNPPES